MWGYIKVEDTMNKLIHIDNWTISIVRGPISAYWYLMVDSGGPINSSYCFETRSEKFKNVLEHIISNYLNNHTCEEVEGRINLYGNEQFITIEDNLFRIFWEEGKEY